jgi:hypothetical protein
MTKLKILILIFNNYIGLLKRAGEVKENIFIANLC